MGINKMNYNKKIRNSLSNIENKYDLETASEVSLNLSFVNSFHENILDAHSKNDSKKNSSQSFIETNSSKMDIESNTIKRSYASFSEICDESFLCEMEPEKRLKPIEIAKSF